MYSEMATPAINQLSSVESEPVGCTCHCFQLLERLQLNLLDKLSRLWTIMNADWGATNSLYNKNNRVQYSL